MFILNALAQFFLLPGTLVLKWIGITPEEDGGILRSFINMCFWGALSVWIILKIFI